MNKTLQQKSVKPVPISSIETATIIGQLNWILCLQVIPSCFVATLLLLKDLPFVESNSPTHTPTHSLKNTVQYLHNSTTQRVEPFHLYIHHTTCTTNCNTNAQQHRSSTFFLQKEITIILLKYLPRFLEWGKTTSRDGGLGGGEGGYFWFGWLVKWVLYGGRRGGVDKWCIFLGYNTQSGEKVFYWTWRVEKICCHPLTAPSNSASNSVQPQTKNYSILSFY